MSSPATQLTSPTCRIEERHEFQGVGLSDDDITGWIKAETGVFFPYGRLAEILQGLPE